MSFSSIPFIQKIIAFIVSVLAFFGISVGGQTTQETTTEEPASVVSEASSKFAVELEANKTTGYEWTYVIEGSADGEIIASAGSEYVTSGISGINTGTGGTQYFYFTTVKEGTAVIVFSYARAFGSSSAAKTKTVKVTVDANLKATVTEVNA